MKLSRSSRRRIAAVAFVGLVASAGTAMAASNTVSDRNAGSGTSVISGFTVADVGYVADGAFPAFVAAVTFEITRDVNSGTVDSTNAEVLVSLDLGDTFYPCTVSYGSAMCVITGEVAFADVVTADVVAYDLKNTAT